jgi:hypothetical protein
MAQVFPRYTNTLSRVSAVALAGLVLTGLWLAGRIQRSPYTTDVLVAKTQPVPFSHEHHVAGLGIDCRYCHTTVEVAATAGIPPTATCMNCHRQIWADSPMLEPVRESMRTGKPLEWTRVHDLPDFAYFNHSVHVQRGVGCSSCHGRVDRMPLMWQTETLHMEWCVDCHRDPKRHLRKPGEIVAMDWTPPAKRSDEELEPHQRGVRTLQACSYCHR